MPRIVWFIIDNGTYHGMTRGNNRNNLFLYDDDFLRYFDILIENQLKFPVAQENK